MIAKRLKALRAELDIGKLECNKLVQFTYNRMQTQAGKGFCEARQGFANQRAEQYPCSPGTRGWV